MVSRVVGEDDEGWDVVGEETPVTRVAPVSPVAVPVPVPAVVETPVVETSVVEAPVAQRSVTVPVPVPVVVETPVVQEPVVETGDEGFDDEVGKDEMPLESAVSRPKAKRKSRSKGRKMPGGIRLTDRDYALLTFLGRYRLATIGQLARRFDTSASALRNRLPRLEAAGFLTWAYTGQTKPKVWTVTETGLRVAGVSLGTPQIKWGTLRHTLGLVDLGITFEEAGELVVTEREIRAASTRYMPTARMRAAIEMRAAVAVERGEVVGVEDSPRLAKEGYVLPMTGRQFGHIPDMVLVRQPFPNGLAGSLAIELELNRKTLSEWNLVLSTYRDSTAFASVVYYVVDADIERALVGAIRALGADQKIHVVRFTPIDTTAEPGTSELL
jgi:hypothetical protein